MIFSADVVFRHLRGLLWLLLVQSFLVAFTEDKLSNHNVQLALDLLGATGKANARSRYMACRMRVHPYTNKLGDSY